MAKNDLLAVYDHYESSWVARDWTAFRDALHPEYGFLVGGTPIGDVEQTIEWSAQLLRAFPDYEQSVNARHLTEDVLIVEAVASGTSNGEPPSVGLPAPRAGTRFQLPYVKVLRFENGLIRDDRQYHDTGSLVAQLYPESRASETSARG